MASNYVTVNVSLDRAIHEELMKFAQSMVDEHKIQVHRVRFDWINADSFSGSKSIVKDVHIESSMRK